jgi:Rps23 Pro-64 3,4-dihydroxylase Tpa1-like proline 4-hydroxylase
MDFTFVADGINAVVIDNFYTSDEEALVLSDCMSVLPQMMDESHTSGALDSNGSVIKKNHGAFIKSTGSALESLSKNKIFSIEVRDRMLIANSLYKILFGLNRVETLLSYYSDGDYYNNHIDDSIFTAVVYLYKQPKKFSGGEIVLQSYIQGTAATIDCLHNRAIIFPSVTPHSVKPIKLLNDSGSDGRFCISHFINYEDVRNDSN